MKKSKLVLLTLCSVVLSSCVKTKELYPINAYDTGNFETNYYLEHTGPKDSEIVEHISLTTEAFRENPKLRNSEQKQFENLKDEDQKLDDKYLIWDYDTPGYDYGKGFGPTKNLGNINSSFNDGFMSRLYDGRVRCDGKTYARTRVQIEKHGYSTYFPKTLDSAKYFGVALRGQVGYDGATTTAIVDLHISLYQEVSGGYRALDFNINDLTVRSNTHGDTDFVYFYFDKVFQDNSISDYQQYLKGVKGMSMSFDLKNYNLPTSETEKGAPTDDITDNSAPHYSLMLYEVMLPDSTWR